MTSAGGRVVMPVLGFVLALAAGADAADLNEDGKAAYARGDYAAAERLFSRAAAEAPGDPLLQYHRGVALMRLSRWGEASAAFEAALRLGPTADVAAAAREGIRSLAPLLQRAAPASARAEETLVALRRLSDGNWTAQVRLNDLRTARFLVDTGASTCVISPALASELRIRPDPDAAPVEMLTLSGRTSGSIVRIASVQVGEAEAEDVVAVIHPTGPSVDGILGNTFLSRFTVTLDPGRKVLSLRGR